MKPVPAFLEWIRKSSMISVAWLSNYDDDLCTCRKCVTWQHVFQIS